MIIGEIGEPLILRAKEGECLLMRKSIKGGYVIESALCGDNKFEGKIIIEYDVNPIIRPPKPEDHHG